MSNKKKAKSKTLTALSDPSNFGPVIHEKARVLTDDEARVLLSGNALPIRTPPIE